VKPKNKKMRIIFFMTGLLTTLLFASCTQNPNAEEILKISFEKCQSVENGYYEMTHYMKYMSGNDTISSSYNCYFKKLTTDTIYSSSFHYQQYRSGEYSRDIMYTGDDFVNYSTKDSTGEIMSKTLWAKNIKAYSHNYTFYTPFTNNETFPLPHDSTFFGDIPVFKFIGEEIINNISCYHVKMNIYPENDSTEMMKTMRAEINYWISKQDYIPIQYTIAHDMVMNNDTMCQFEKNVLTKHELNNVKVEKHLKLESIPSYINLKDYKPYKSPELLPNDIIAPDWTLISLKDKTVSLDDLKGKLVLIDFFYKSCYPCMQALPALQDLHERYKDKGLKIIGIDPYDTKEKDDIDNFLAKRGVTYTVLLGGKDAANEYHVTGYPTVYLIDEEGKIIFTQVGYGEGTEDKLEEVIKQNL